MGSEAGLWKTVQKNMGDKWKVQRVENMVGPGTPDVYYTLISGDMGWLELKHEKEWPKRATTALKVDHFTPQQRGWLRRHGGFGAKVFVLIQVDKQYFLLDWEEAQNIGGKHWDPKYSKRPWTKEDYEELTYKWERRINYSELYFALK